MWLAPHKSERHQPCTQAPGWRVRQRPRPFAQAHSREQGWDACAGKVPLYLCLGIIFRRLTRLVRSSELGDQILCLRPVAQQVCRPSSPFGGGAHQSIQLILELGFDGSNFLQHRSKRNQSICGRGPKRGTASENQPRGSAASCTRQVEHRGAALPSKASRLRVPMRTKAQLCAYR